MIRPGSPNRTWSAIRALQIVGGLLVAAVVIALPASLAFIAPEALGASGFIGDPSAAALHSLDRTLQGQPAGELLSGASAGAPPCAPFALPGPSTRLAGRLSTSADDVVRPSPIDNGTTLLL